MSGWLKTFQKAPDGYVCREFRHEDGVLEGIEISNPIIGGTMENADGVPVAYAGVNLIAGRHWVFFYIKDEKIREHGLWIIRLIRDSLEMCRKGGITELYGLCDTTRPNATPFMTKLGFKPLSVYDKSVDVMLYEKLMGGQAKAWLLRIE